jgi:hypothetical protein
MGPRALRARPTGRCAIRTWGRSRSRLRALREHHDHRVEGALQVHAGAEREQRRFYLPHHVERSAGLADHLGAEHLHRDHPGRRRRGGSAHLHHQRDGHHRHRVDLDPAALARQLERPMDRRRELRRRHGEDAERRPRQPDRVVPRRREGRQLRRRQHRALALLLGRLDRWVRAHHRIHLQHESFRRRC